MRKGQQRKIKAWLVTWEWSGDHAKRENIIAAIFNPRWGGDRVREFVEFFYANEYTLAERMDLVRGKPNPYPAEFGKRMGGKGTWKGEIFCGHNPFLRARVVDDLTVERNMDGKEIAAWKERPRPKPIPEMEG
jgi:hypothetical protein